MMAPKAQAAMEFLMTYGWAILVVLVVIGALAYFGVLNPTNVLPEKCFFQVGLECNQHQFKSASATLLIKNALGDKITITKAWVEDPATGSVICGSSTANLTSLVVIQNSASGTVSTSTSCNLGTVGTKVKLVPKLVYYKGTAGAFTHTASGDVITTIES